jgi:uncharacterized protein (DUF58 family)
MQETENDILKRVRKIEIKTRGLSNEIFAGKYHTAFRGRGMSFSEVREYRAGDDVRDIDWNVTARSRKPHIKIYEEERELTMMLLVDVSASRMFGTTERLKKNIITEIAAVLAFSAAQNNDKVGCIFFSDKVEKFIPPKKGRSHILMIIRELVGFRPESDEALGAGAFPDQRQQETLHDLHPLGFHGLLEGQGGAGRRAEDRRRQARPGGHTRLRPA